MTTKLVTVQCSFLLYTGLVFSQNPEEKNNMCVFKVLLNSFMVFIYSFFAFCVIFCVSCNRSISVMFSVLAIKHLKSYKFSAPGGVQVFNADFWGCFSIGLVLW